VLRLRLGAFEEGTESTRQAISLTMRMETRVPERSQHIICTSGAEHQ
jgi:hypothetical protein